MIPGLIVCAAAVMAIAALAWWLRSPPAQLLAERLPGPDEEAIAKTAVTSAVEIVNLEGQFGKFDGAVVKPSGAWPRFRGSNFDNISTQQVPLAESWPETGPAAIWSVELGDGYAGPAVLNGRVYVLDYDEKEESDSLRCFSFNDGKEIWRRWYKSPTKRNHGMSRTVPAVTEKYVVTIGPRCHVLCVDTETGKFRWGIDLVREYGTKVPLWYTAQCPLIDGSTAVIAPGGKALMIGVDCESGKILWQTPNPKNWEMSHAVVVPMLFKGRKMYVYAAIGGMVGISADEADRGAVLWETTEWNHSVIAPSPVVFDDGRIFVTAGYCVGSAMFRLTDENSRFTAKQVYRLDRKVFACEQHTPILYKGSLYSILPADAGATKQQLVCMNPDGNVIWASGQTERFGLGPFLIADEKMFIMNDDGILTMIRASADGYTKLAQAKVLSGHEAWAPLAIVDGRLLVRDTTRMVCLDVAKPK